MTYIQKFIGHAKTVHKHRAMVRKLCFKCGLYWQGLTHDLSKYSPTEFFNGVKYYTGFASPHVEERKHKGYSDAWMHHKGRNKHHAEYWQDIDWIKGNTRPIKMPYKYFVEMVCDRTAACMIYLKDRYTNDAPLNYYNAHIDENQFNPATREELEKSLTMIAKHGFDNFASYAWTFI